MVVTVFENYSEILILASEASYINFLEKKNLSKLPSLPLEISSPFCDFTVPKESARFLKNFQGAKKHHPRFQN